MGSRKTKDSKLDVADLLTDDKTRAEFLRIALREEGVAGFLRALGVVARSKGMRQVAGDTGLNRENLYRTLSADSNPGIKTVESVLASLGFELDLRPKRRAAVA